MLVVSSIGSSGVAAVVLVVVAVEVFVLVASRGVRSSLSLQLQ